MFTIQQALEAYFSTSIGTYGGAQAGSGMYGIDGAGVISRYADGRVFSENGTVTQTLPDGTQITRVIEDGERNELIKSPDGSVTLIQGDSTRIQYQTRWADGRVTERTYVDTSSVHSETVVEHFPGGLTTREYRSYTNGVYRKEEFNAKGECFHVIYDNPAEYRREYRLNDDGSWSQKYSYYNSDGKVDGTYYQYNKKNDADTVLAGDYLNYRYEMRQHDGGPKEITETTSYYTGAMEIPDWGTSYIGVTIARSVRTEFPDGREVSGETDVWDARYEWREHQNVYVPREPPPPDNDHLYGPSLEVLGNAVIERLRDLSGSRKSGVITLENGTVSFSIEAHFGTSGNDQIQGTGFLYGADGNDTLAGGAERDTLLGGDGNDTLAGGGGNDRLGGGKDDDTVDGGSGDDTLNGDDGNDVLVGNLGSDTLDGGEGLDVASYEQATSGVVANLADATQNTGQAAGDTYTSIEGIAGSAYDDRLAGTAANNILFGYIGNDRLIGLAGNDILIGGSGADTLEGGEGFDIVSYAEAAAGVVVTLIKDVVNTGEAAGDVFFSVEGLAGSKFADVLTGNSLSNILGGGAGDDVLVGGGGGDSLSGDAGNDRLFSRIDADLLDGGEGWDTVSYYKALSGVQVYLWKPIRNRGEAGGDTYTGIEVFDGSRYGDVLEGDYNKNTFWGDDGNDSLKGRAGDDVLSGGNGDDVLDGGLGVDTLNGGSGFDTASYADAKSNVRVDLGNADRNLGEAYGDVFVSIEKVVGSSYNDTLEASSTDTSFDRFEGGEGQDLLKGYGGVDTLQGGAGDDQLVGGTRGDVLDGGLGYDFAVYTDALEGVVVDLADAARNQGFEAAGDVFVSIEGVKGSAFADHLCGDGGGNTLVGNAGDDRLEGRAGGDWLDGGDGRDHAVYWGAAGAVRASLLLGYGSAGEAGGDTYRSIEGLEGSASATGCRAMGQATRSTAMAATTSFWARAATTTSRAATEPTPSRAARA